MKQNKFIGSDYSHKKVFILLSMTIIISLFSFNLISSAIIVETHGLSWAGSAAGRIGWDGFRIQANYNLQLTNMTRSVDTDCTHCALLNADKSENVTGIFVGNVCTFVPGNITTLIAGLTYYIGATTPGPATCTENYKNNVVYPINGTNINWTGGIDEGNSDTTNAGAISNITLTNSTSSIGELNIILLIPANNSVLSTDGTNFTFNGTITSSNNLNFTNASYYVWKTDGNLFNLSTIILPSSNYTNYSLFINNFTLGQNYLWNVKACYGNSTYQTCSWSNNGNFTFFNLPFSTSSVDYISSVLETTYQQLNISIIANPQVSSVSGYFWYNGTRYITSITDGSGGVYTAKNFIDIPLQESSGNKTFLWEFQFTLNDGSVVKSNTSSYQQEVSRAYLEFCNATYTTKALNFTTKNAENPFPRVNATFKAAFSWYVQGGMGSIKRNLSYENLSEIINNFPFCLSPNTTLITSAILEYDATGYAINYYYLLNTSISNNNQNINLFLLNDSKATAVTLKVEDIYTKAVEDVYIQILSYDVGTDTYHTIGMAHSDFNGEDVAYLNLYNTFYKFILTKNGQIIKITNVSKISATPYLFKIEDTYTYTYDKFGNIQYTLTFNNITKNFIFTYSNPTGGISSYCLRVVKRTPKNDTQICNTCETSSSATIYCNVNSYGNGTYVAVIYGQGSLAGWDSLVAFVGTINEIYDLIGNVDGSIYAFFIAAIVLVMFLFSPVMAVVGALLGMVIGVALGFQPLHYTEMFGVIILGVVVILILKR